MNALRKYLENRTKGDFARKLGITPAYLSHIQSGIKSPGKDLMWRIERETGGEVPMSAWFDDEAAA